MNGLHVACLIPVLAVILTTPSARADEPQRFVQDRFAIGLWVDPPINENADRYYRDLARANFTMVIGGFGARTPEQVTRQLELCEKHALKAVVNTAGLQPGEYPEGPACWGYRLKDEPNVDDCPQLADWVLNIREHHPGKLAYINLYPDYASPAQMKVDTYEEYVARFMEEVDPDVLSMDHYPAMQPDSDRRQAYCDNLAVMREWSLRNNVPHWNYFNAMPFAHHFDPTEHSIRWQVFTALAYGSKGILYFCYWTPHGKIFDKDGAVITREGRRTRHFDQARRINRAVKQLGPTLMQLTSTGVYRVGEGSEDQETLAGSGIRSLARSPHGEYLIGSFVHSDGRRAVLINNYDYLYTSWPTVEFDAEAADIVEVCQETGAQMPLRDDSPAIDGIQISLDAGGGRLFLLPAR